MVDSLFAESRDYLLESNSSAQLSGDPADDRVCGSECDVSQYGLERRHGICAGAGGVGAE